MPEPQRVAIVGARNASEATLEAVRELVRKLPAGTVVVSGGAPGVDRIAIMTARDIGSPFVEYYPEDADTTLLYDPADSQTLERRASAVSPDYRSLLLLRNSMIAAECTRLVAFPDNSKGGTRDAVRQAERFKRPYAVVQKSPWYQQFRSGERWAWHCASPGGKRGGIGIMSRSEWWPEVFGK